MEIKMGSPTLLTVATLSCIGLVASLRCWHCIADDCDQEPSDNFKARKKACNAGQSCQKVYFEMFDENLRQQYTSTIRGCSSECKLKNDFDNCTTQLRTTRGCVRKDCCHDNDFCNGSDITKLSIKSMCLLVLMNFLLFRYL